MKPPRIIFNFVDKKLNKCEFCFTPFNNKGEGNLELYKKIMERIYFFKPTLISFSGCDPLYYDDFYELLASVEKRALYSVDTSLIYLNKDKYASIADKIDLISTSIDDSFRQTKRQRYDDTKLKLFYENLDFVRKFNKNIVIHTLYSKYNKDYLHDIADVIVNRDIKTWSLYQYWPFDFNKYNKFFFTKDEEFNRAGENLKKYIDNRLDFDYVTYKGRANGYMFVTSLGEVYTTLPGDVGKYQPLGTIFDKDILEKWELYSHNENAKEILELKIRREQR